MRDWIVSKGVIMETFETAVTWDRFETFHRAIVQAVSRAIEEHCGTGYITCRFTHVYPDGPAPYYTVVARGKKGQLLEQWQHIKQAASGQ